MLTRRGASLLVGDLVALTFFAILGRNTHGEAVGLDAIRHVAGTAAPFLVGWIAAVPIAGALRTSATGAMRPMFRVTLATWIAAFPLAMLVRGFALGRTSPLSFYIVAFSFSLLLLLAWRTAFALIEGLRGIRGQAEG